MWNVLTVPTVWYFNCPKTCGVFLMFLQCGILTVPDCVECSYCFYSVVFYLSTTMWNVLTVPTVWYFNCSRQCGIYLSVPTVWYFNWSNNVVFKLSATIWNVLIVPIVWYFNCPQTCGVFLMFLQCGILTVHDSVEYSYCSYSLLC